MLSTATAGDFRSTGTRQTAAAGWRSGPILPGRRSGSPSFAPNHGEVVLKAPSDRRSTWLEHSCAFAENWTLLKPRSGLVLLTSNETGVPDPVCLPGSSFLMQGLPGSGPSLSMSPSSGPWWLSPLGVGTGEGENPPPRRWVPVSPSPKPHPARACGAPHTQPSVLMLRTRKRFAFSQAPVLRTIAPSPQGRGQSWR